MPDIYFPSDNFTGIPRNRFFDEPPDFDKITDSWEYEDGGKDFNEVSDNAPRHWEYGYTGLTPAQAVQFDEFNSAVRRSVPFLFVDKLGQVWNNVYIAKYERTWNAHKSWDVDVKFELVGYTSTVIDIIDLTPPVVSITSPTMGQTVSGTITIAAIATDNIGVDRVEFFYFDGEGFAPISQDPSIPYTANFDTTTVPNGLLHIEAIAFDTDGNQSPTASVDVTVDNGTHFLTEDDGDLLTDDEGNFLIEG